MTKNTPQPSKLSYLRKWVSHTLIFSLIVGVLFGAFVLSFEFLFLDSAFKLARPYSSFEPTTASPLMEAHHADDLKRHFTLHRTVRAKIRLHAVVAFFFGFIGSFLLLKHKNYFVILFKNALNRIQAGHLDAPLEIPDEAEWGDVFRSFNEMLEALKERDRMRHSLGRIMDPKIAEILIKENPKLGGLRRQATILFCDIRNYTTICEQLSVDELQEFLNEYWKGTVEIIMDQEGTIDKFHGDGVCVIFGAPNLHEDDPLRAVRVASRLVKNVESLNKKRQEQRKIPIQIGIGIHSGEVIAGNIGSERRMDYTVVGDVVNIAARIEELNKKYGTKILISDKVYEAVEDFVRVKTLSLAHLRGHKRPILIHSVMQFFDPNEEISDQKVA